MVFDMGGPAQFLSRLYPPLFVQLLFLVCMKAHARIHRAPSLGSICDSQPCQHGGECIDLTSTKGVRKFQCACMEGYQGLTCQKRINPCADEPCLNGGQCMPRGEKFHCVCSKGFDGKTCDMEVKDPCNSKPCDPNGFCIPVNSDFSCECAPGFYGPRCQEESNAKSKARAGKMPLKDEKDSSVWTLVIILLVTVIIIVVILMLMAIHCVRVYNRRSNLQASRERLKVAGEEVSEMPGVCDTSNSMCADFFCCRDRQKCLNEVTGVIVPVEEYKSMVYCQRAAAKGSKPSSREIKNDSMQTRQDLLQNKEPFGLNVSGPISGQNSSHPPSGQNLSHSPPGQNWSHPPSGQNWSHPPSVQNLSLPQSGQNWSHPPSGQNFPLPPSGQNFPLPPSGQNFPLPHSGQNLSHPPSGQMLSLPPSGQNLSLPPSGQNLSRHPSGQNLSHPPSGQNLSPSVYRPSQNMPQTVPNEPDVHPESLRQSMSDTGTEASITNNNIMSGIPHAMDRPFRSVGTPIQMSLPPSEDFEYESAFRCPPTYLSVPRNSQGNHLMRQADRSNSRSLRSLRSSKGPPKQYSTQPRPSKQKYILLRTDDDHDFDTPERNTHHRKRHQEKRSVKQTIPNINNAGKCRRYHTMYNNGRDDYNRAADEDEDSQDDNSQDDNDDDDDDDDGDDDNDDDDADGDDDDDGEDDDEEEEKEEDIDEHRNRRSVKRRPGRCLDDGYESTSRLSESDGGGRSRDPQSLQTRLSRQKKHYTKSINRDNRWQRDKTDLKKSRAELQLYDCPEYEPLRPKDMYLPPYSSRDRADPRNEIIRYHTARGGVSTTQIPSNKAFERQLTPNSLCSSRVSSKTLKRKMKRGEILETAMKRFPHARLGTASPQMTSPQKLKGILKKGVLSSRHEMADLANNNTELYENEAFDVFVETILLSHQPECNKPTNEIPSSGHGIMKPIGWSRKHSEHLKCP